jgi:CRP/FNR family transcriptional regulator, cyclic AMP receptor protein
MSAPIDTLKNVPLFSDLDDRELAQIADTLKERRFKAGDTLVAEGAQGSGFFIVAEGEAAVDVGGEDKGTVGPGGYFGEIALLKDSTRTATLTAQTDMLCYGMTSWEFKPLIEGNSGLAWKLLTAMADKVN